MSKIKTIYLIGFMGSGKSTVGYELAKQLDVSYIDTDEYIEEMHGEISRIFKDKGEETFRSFEIAALKATTNYTIVSTGGGIVEKKENIHIMSNNGVTIYLHTSFNEISKRLGQDQNRPLWNKKLEDQKGLYNRRNPLYKEFSDHIINTDGKSIQRIVQEITNIILKYKLINLRKNIND